MGGSSSFSWPWIPEPRDIGIQTLLLIVLPAGVGGRSWPLEALGVGGQSLSDLPTLGDIPRLPTAALQGGCAVPPGTSEKRGQELKPLGREVFLAQQVQPVLASWQLSPGLLSCPGMSSVTLIFLESGRERELKVLSCRV